MREILFRGKRVDNGEWIYGFYVGDTGDCCHEICDINSGTGHRVEVSHETVGQYTGMKDKNGKRIFEGDIVVDKDTGNIKTVEYHGCRFVFVSLLRHFYHAFYEEDWEVIGNIHDNRELLGGDDHE